jgi:bifunctional DNA-binding transcriptional regulator/antitoxin component of YhaV-PrlF toxin-antitoxin module
MHTSVTAEARLRAKSQLTLPNAVVRATNVSEGDRFVVEVAPDDPDTIRLHRVRSSYAGALHDVFDDAADYLVDERLSWAGGG